MNNFSINAERLIARLHEHGTIGRDAEGRLARIAGTDADKAGRDCFVAWLRAAGLQVEIDRIGNIFGIWATEANQRMAPIMMGSHIDTVVNAGIYDGNYGVLAGLEVIESLKAQGFQPQRPLVVAAFTNEEGARYAPDMMGSLVYVGGLALEDALKSIGNDGSVLGSELARIGYAGPQEPGFMKPHAYVELHIEQGPVLEREGIVIGAVENLQGISWQRITLGGTANHAGTTPLPLRRDAGYAAARTMVFVRDLAAATSPHAVATVGTLRLDPNVINVIPSRAQFTVDLRDPNDTRLAAMERALADFLQDLANKENMTLVVDRLARFEPVVFDTGLVEDIENAARTRGKTVRRMTSGAGHDAQMMARLCPSAMIFVPSIGGISHNPREATAEADLVAGAEILLDVIADLASI